MDLAKLNSATKYPSIETYHEMGDRGRLKDVVQVPFPAGQPIFVTEKVDGTNGRVVLLPADRLIKHHIERRFLIGSREEFLYADKDLVYQKEYGIVDALRTIGEQICPGVSDTIFSFFFEIYGGDLPASKQYTESKKVGLKLFDVARVPLEILERPIEKVASWRDHGGQEFMGEEELPVQLRAMNTMDTFIERVPSFQPVEALPTTVEATYEWLKQFEQSKCDLGGGRGRTEGVVVRTADRKTIAKIRFEDYERTLGMKKK